MFYRTYISHASRIHLTRVSYIPIFHYTFGNQIGNPPKPFGVILCMFSKSIRLLYFISHIPNFHYEFQNQIATPQKPFAVWLCACLVSLLGPYVLSRTHLMCILHSLNFHYAFEN